VGRKGDIIEMMELMKAISQKEKEKFNIRFKLILNFGWFKDVVTRKTSEE